MLKPLIVGLCPGYSHSGLYKRPFYGPCETRLMKLCSLLGPDSNYGESLNELLGTFGFVNLLSQHDPDPDLEDLRAAADDMQSKWRCIVGARPPEVILCGAQVCKAFGVPYVPLSFISIDTWPACDAAKYFILPHPSGRCRWWNDPENVRRAMGSMTSIYRRYS